MTVPSPASASGATGGEVPADLRVWTAVLDRIEATIHTVDPDGDLDLQAEFDAIGGFEPPEGIGTMPDALLERAQALLTAVNQAADRVAAAQAAIGSELARHAQTPRRTDWGDAPPTPRMVDHDA